MGQVETKIFEDAPPWAVEEVVGKTDLSEETIDVCWRMWATEKEVSKNKLKEEGFYRLLDIADNNEKEMTQAKKLFELLDKDDDERLEFEDTMLFLFTTDEDMSQEQKLRRSFQLFDRKSNRKISKLEMVEALDLLGLQEVEKDEKGKVIIPDHVENLFSLVDFDQDGKIEEEEFLKITMRYRNLGRYLVVDLLERCRKQLVNKIAEKKAEKGAEDRQNSVDEGTTEALPETAKEATEDTEATKEEKVEEKKEEKEDQEAKE